MCETVKVLVVDDSAAAVHLLKDALERECPVPIEVSVANDGEVALQMIAEGHRPELILLDLNLPKVDGFTVLDRLYVPECRIPVIILSNSDRASDVQKADELGASAYYRKPIDYGAFVDTVRSICEAWIHPLAAGRRLTQ